MNLKSVNLLKNNLLLVLIVLFGAALRLFRLSAKSVWIDEAMSLSFAEYGWKEIFFHRYNAKPVYFFLLKAWTALFGSGELAARSLGVLFGIVSIFLIYILAAKLFNKRAALISAFLLSVSPYHIYYSQQIRNYSLFVLLGLLSMIIFIRTWRERRGRIRALVAVNVLLVYTHGFGIFVPLVQSLFLMVNKKIDRRWVAGGCVTLVLLLPLAAVFLHNPSSPLGNEIGYKWPKMLTDLATPNPGSLLELIEVFAYGGPRQAHAGVGPVDINGYLMPLRILTVLFFSLMLHGLTPLFKARDGNPVLRRAGTEFFLTLWLLLPILITYALSIFFVPLFLTRYFIFTSISFYLITAASMTRLSGKLRVGVICLIIALSLVSLKIMFRSGSSDDWRGLSAYCRTRMNPGDRFLVVPLENIVPLWYYLEYGKREPLKGIDKYGKRETGQWKERFFFLTHPVTGIRLDESVGGVRGKVRELKNAREDIWLIIAPDSFGRERSRLVKEELEDFCVRKEVSSFEYNGVKAECYSLK